MKLKCSYILPHYFSVLYIILLFSLSISQEVQPVPEFCSESPSTFSTFRIKSSASAAPLFPTVNTSLFMKYFEGYHLSNNEISSFQGNLTYFTTVYLETNITALMVNPENNKTAYIGFGTEEVKESSDKERQIKFKFFFQFNSENLKKGSWDFEFGIHDDSMMCYYCLDEKHAKMSNITNPTKCKVDIQFKTWGARNIISSQVDLLRWVEDNSYRKFSNSKNYGGYFNRAQNGYQIFHVLMWMIPFASYVVNVFHFDTKDIDINKNPIAIIGYICTSAITTAYIMFSFILFYLCEYFLENIITALFLPFFILMFLATVSCTCLIMYTALLDHKLVCAYSGSYHIS
ncbi:unnamed protein product [Moneuplotes crassus]|uniref:Uncharacterized protein n=1 Tax=Euplotes crassus TaxID=5936 RepID=A0AAD1X758_EUPCR|nr:unnamed protein product [Moneuplotes crassus]